VGGLALSGGGRKVSAKEVAIEERVLVVATWRAHAVGPAGGLVIPTARAIAVPRDIEPVVAWRQTNVQSNNLDHVFGKTEPAPAEMGRASCRGSGSSSRGAASFSGNALRRFRDRAVNGGTPHVVGLCCHPTPSRTGL